MKEINSQSSHNKQEVTALVSTGKQWRCHLFPAYLFSSPSFSIFFVVVVVVVIYLCLYVQQDRLFWWGVAVMMMLEQDAEFKDNVYLTEQKGYTRTLATAYYNNLPLCLLGSSLKRPRLQLSSFLLLVMISTIIFPIFCSFYPIPSLSPFPMSHTCYPIKKGLAFLF